MQMTLWSMLYIVGTITMDIYKTYFLSWLRKLYFKGEIKKKREIPLKTFMAEIFKHISIAANAIECNNSMEYFSSQRK